MDQNASVTSISPSFDELVAEYRNTAEHNDQLWRLMTTLTRNEPCLSVHRRYIEENRLGFGDAAFHAMWLRLLDKATRRFGTVRALEIGVFKGQVISLWAMIGKHWKINVQITAISPLTGQPLPKSKLVYLIRRYFDPGFREKLRNSNFYPDEDYAGIIKQLFDRFELDHNALQVYRGYSTDRQVLDLMAQSTFHIVYVDGDHTLKGAAHDFRVFGPKVVGGGWLVADDASCALPGSAFWKGHEAVSHAAEMLPAMGFRNILNVGHNRIYELDR